jgi:hypothetical protein
MSPQKLCFIFSAKYFDRGIGKNSLKFGVRRYNFGRVFSPLLLVKKMAPRHPLRKVYSKWILT